MVVAFLYGVFMVPSKVSAEDVYGCDAASAGEIEFGTDYSGSLSTKGDYKQHWYKFTTMDTDDYYYNMEFKPLLSKGSFILSLIDENGKVIKSVNKGTRKEQVKLSPGTEYYLKGYCPSGISDDNCYHFQVDLIDDPETDSMADASIELVNKKAYNGTIATDYEEDWFIFKARGDESTIQISKKDDNWGLSVAVYDANGNRMNGETVGRTFTGSITVDTVKGNMYYVCASSNSSFDYGEEKDVTYSLTLFSGKDEVKKLSAPTSLADGKKVIVGKAIPNATVKCIYEKKTYTVKANSKGKYTIKLKQSLKKNKKVVLWQVVDGTASEKLTVKVRKK